MTSSTADRIHALRESLAEMSPEQIAAELAVEFHAPFSTPSVNDAVRTRNLPDDLHESVCDALLPLARPYRVRLTTGTSEIAIGDNGCLVSIAEATAAGARELAEMEVVGEFEIVDIRTGVAP